MTQESSLGSECWGKGLAVVEVDRLSSVVVVYFLLRCDQMPGSQKFLQDFHRKFLSNYSGISNVCLEMSRDSKICTYYNTAQLSTSYKKKQQELEM